MDLVELYEPMIKSIIKKYLEYAGKVGLDYDDLFQEASMAVLRAENTYKDNKGMKLETWIYNNIDWRIQRVLESNKKYEKIISINSTVESSEGDTTELIDLIADDLDLEEEIKNKLMLNYYESECKRVLKDDFEVAYLRWFKGMPCKAIESILSIDKATYRINNCRRKLIQKSRVFHDEYMKLIGINDYSSTERAAIM